MEWLGAACCLLAAMMHAVAFVLSRRYVVARHTSSIRLLAIAHAWMGLWSAALLAAIWPTDMPPVSELASPVVNAVWPYLVANGLFLVALRRTNASRVAPLLGLKIVAVAMLVVFWQRDPLLPLQWVAVGIAVAAAFALNYTGGSLPLPVVAAVLTAVCLFSVSDLNIKRTLELTHPLGDVLGPLVTTLVYFAVAGGVGVLLLPWLGSRRWADWRAAVPYAAVWLTGLTIMVIGFGLAGIVLGNIALATRGLWSILLGVLIAHRGHHHLEAHVPRSTNIRRALAAAAMIAAIAMYVAV